jgi:type I restriction enzyme M protein
MESEGLVRVSRADIARHAGVQRAAVTNWISRHADFPHLSEAEGAQLFDAFAVAAWLDRRKIPAHGLLAGEIEGQATYGQRFRRNLGLPSPSLSQSSHPHTDPIPGEIWRLIGQLRDELRPDQILSALAPLIYLQGRHPAIWGELLESPSHALGEYLLDHAWRRAMAEEERKGISFSELVHRTELVDSRAIGSIIDALDRVHGSVRQALGPGSSKPASATMFLALVEQHVRAVGRKSAEFFTPRTVVRLAVDLLEPSRSTPRIYDPFCRAGEFLDEAASRLVTDSGFPPDITIHGQHSDRRLCSIALMNLRLHGADPEIRIGHWWDGYTAEKYDLVFVNPPFNMRLPEAAVSNRPWRYGEPPRHNGNFAWIQHVLSSLRPGGKAAVVMPNNAGVATNPRERAIRAALVDDGVVECVIALPAQLFPGTGIPVSLWVLRSGAEPADGVLLIDATRMGTTVAHGVRTLSDADLRRIRTAHARWTNGKQVNVPDFARSVTLSTIRAHDYGLNPSVYVERPRADREPPDPIAELARHQRTVSELTDRLRDIELAAARSDTVLERQLLLEQSWTTVSLAELCDMKSGPSGSRLTPVSPGEGTPILLPKHLRNGHIVDGEPVTVPTEIAEKLGDYLLAVDDLVCTRVGDLGRVARVGRNHQGWLLSTGLVRLRVITDDVLPAYLAHVLASPKSRGWIARNATGTVVPAVAIKTLARLPVIVPPIGQQRLISTALDGISERAQIYAKLADTTLLTLDTLADALMAEG